MPLLKHPRLRQPLWNEWDEKANKKGVLHTVYGVNGDEYTGEWQRNKKHGQGTYKWKKTGYTYDGSWENDMRDGFGTLSIPTTNGLDCIKQYTGEWKHNKKHGYGTNVYEDSVYYEGEWSCGKRHGWGKMVYKDCSVYEGRWENDMRHGEGMLRLADESRYEGSWQNDKKHGKGRFFYVNKGQQYIGYWIDDVAKAGEVVDYNREEAPLPTEFPIPEITLADPKGVLRSTVLQFNLDLTTSDQESVVSEF